MSSFYLFCEHSETEWENFIHEANTGVANEFNGDDIDVQFIYKGQTIRSLGHITKENVGAYCEHEPLCSIVAKEGESAVR